MNVKIIALALASSAALAGCSNGAEQIADLESKITEQKQMLTDTVSYFTTTISDMQFQMDSIQAELAKFTAAVSSGGSTKKGTTTPPPPAPTGKIDVTKKGGGDAPQIDVTKKGGGDSPKIDVTKKGGGN